MLHRHQISHKQILGLGIGAVGPLDTKKVSYYTQSTFHPTHGVMFQYAQCLKRNLTYQQN